MGDAFTYIQDGDSSSPFVELEKFVACSNEEAFYQRDKSSKNNSPVVVSNLAEFGSSSCMKPMSIASDCLGAPKILEKPAQSPNAPKQSSEQAFSLSVLKGVERDDSKTRKRVLQHQNPDITIEIKKMRLITMNYTAELDDETIDLMEREDVSAETDENFYSMMILIELHKSMKSQKKLRIQREQEQQPLHSSSFNPAAISQMLKNVSLPRQPTKALNLSHRGWERHRNLEHFWKLKSKTN